MRETLQRRNRRKGCLGLSDQSLILHYDIDAVDFSAAGEASSGVKRTLNKIGVNPAVVKRVAIAMYEAEINAIIHAGGGEADIEITPENAGKGTALAYLAQYLGLEREQVMAMGDAENDLSMLEYAEHSVAMANASDEVKAACRYQTASNDDCGVAAMIDRVLAAKETT